MCLCARVDALATDVQVLGAPLTGTDRPTTAASPSAVAAADDDAAAALAAVGIVSAWLTELNKQLKDRTDDARKSSQRALLLEQELAVSRQTTWSSTASSSSTSRKPTTPSLLSPSQLKVVSRIPSSPSKPLPPPLPSPQTSAGGPKTSSPKATTPKTASHPSRAGESGRGEKENATPSLSSTALLGTPSLVTSVVLGSGRAGSRSRGPPCSTGSGSGSTGSALRRSLATRMDGVVGSGDVGGACTPGIATAMHTAFEKRQSNMRVSVTSTPVGSGSGAAAGVVGSQGRASSAARRTLIRGEMLSPKPLASGDATTRSPTRYAVSPLKQATA